MNPPPSLQSLIDTVQLDAPSDDLLDLLVTASATVRQLEETNDALLEHFVERCRRAGRSWSEISAALGVTKQAVHKRFSGPLADRLIERGSPTFERFTDRARRVLVAAAAAARAEHHDRVVATDLLLGLFAEPDGLAARALLGMQVRQEAVAAVLAAGTDVSAVLADAAQAVAAEAAAQAGEATAPDEVADLARLPFGPDAKAALREALAEALELGHNYIGTEHLLLGLLRDGDSPAAHVLNRLGVSPVETRVRLKELLRSLTKGTGN